MKPAMKRWTDRPMTFDHFGTCVGCDKPEERLDDAAQAFCRTCFFLRPSRRPTGAPNPWGATHE